MFSKKSFIEIASLHFSFKKTLILNCLLILLLPTFGENFGHSIFESLINCCPVLISDQTPWKNLSKKGFGWDLNLIQKEEFASKIDYIASLDLDDYSRIKKNIYKNKSEIYNQEELKINYENLFNL